MAYSFGAGPAAPVPPSHLAPTIDPLSDPRPQLFVGAVSRARAVLEITACRPPAVESADHDEDAGAEIAIEDNFRRQLAGLRRLRRSERPHALRAARDERLLALKTLRDPGATGPARPPAPANTGSGMTPARHDRGGAMSAPPAV